MSNKKIIIKREELYDKVWEKALIKVAADYGLTDNGLKKICNKMNVPIPYNGYWAKLKYHKDVFKTPLPNLKPGDQETYELEIKEKKEKVILERYQKLIELELLPENKIVVPERVARLHPLVKLTKEYISKTKIGYWSDFVEVHGGKIFDTTLSHKTLSRAILILNTLVLECEKRGLEIRTAKYDEDRVETKIIFDNQVYEIELRELIKFEMRERTERYNTQKVVEKVKASSGILKLEIKRDYHWEKVALAKDTKTLKLEDQLNLFFIRLYEITNDQILERIEREKRYKIEQEREREAQRLLAERKREQERTDNLLKLAEDWNRVKYISAFLDEIEFAIKERNLLSEEKKDWLRWARGKMNSMNPINKVIL